MLKPEHDLFNTIFELVSKEAYLISNNMCYGKPLITKFCKYREITNKIQDFVATGLIMVT